MGKVFRSKPRDIIKKKERERKSTKRHSYTQLKYARKAKTEN